MNVVQLRLGLLLFGTGMGIGAVAGCSSGTKSAAANDAATVAEPSATAEQAQPQPLRANPPHHVLESSLVPAPVTNGADATRTIPCVTRDVVLRATGDSSDFNGMSHSGTYLTLTNKSRTACSVPGLPQLTFLDANGPVKAAADLPGAKFMHPGPVVLPIVLQPKQSVTASARWVSGPVYTDNVCYKLTGVSLGLRDGAATTALLGQMCGDRGKGVHYDLQRYGASAK